MRVDGRLVHGFTSYYSAKLTKMSIAEPFPGLFAKCVLVLLLINLLFWNQLGSDKSFKLDIAAQVLPLSEGTSSTCSLYPYTYAFIYLFFSKGQQYVLIFLINQYVLIDVLE